MSLDICKQLSYCYYNQGNIHMQHLPKFSSLSLYLSFVIKALNMQSIVLTNFEMYQLLERCYIANL